MDKPWHEQDKFWEDVEGVLFPRQRRADAAKEVEQIVALMNLKTGMAVLDLCCGVGRHSLEFARRGFRVTAVDRTRKYLDSASGQARTENLDIEFVHEDMRNFARQEAFDAVINIFTSFGYFEDRQDDSRVAEHILFSLKKGGTFIIDMMGKEILARIFEKRGWSEQDGILILEEREIKDSWAWMENRWILIKDGRRIEHRLSHRLYSAEEMRYLLEKCGFSGSMAYGDLAGNPYDHTARRLVTFAWK